MRILLRAITPKGVHLSGIGHVLAMLVVVWIKVRKADISGDLFDS